MDLRAVQQPIKDAYRADPDQARITLTARGSAADAPVACSVDLGRAIYEAQAHTGVGGAGTAACSGDLLLGALAACAQLTCQMVATAMGLDVRSIETTVEGDLDLRGTLGLDREVGAGFSALRLRFAVDAPDASEEDLDALLRKTERYCTVAQTLMSPPGLVGRDVALTLCPPAHAVCAALTASSRKGVSGRRGASGRPREGVCGLANPCVADAADPPPPRTTARAQIAATLLPLGDAVDAAQRSRRPRTTSSARPQPREEVLEHRRHVDRGRIQQPLQLQAVEHREDLRRDRLGVEVGVDGALALRVGQAVDEDRRGARRSERGTSRGRGGRRRRSRPRGW